MGFLGTMRLLFVDEGTIRRISTPAGVGQDSEEQCPPSSPRHGIITLGRRWARLERARTPLPPSKIIALGRRWVRLGRTALPSSTRQCIISIGRRWARLGRTRTPLFPSTRQHHPLIFYSLADLKQAIERLVLHPMFRKANTFKVRDAQRAAQKQSVTELQIILLLTSDARQPGTHIFSSTIRPHHRQNMSGLPQSFACRLSG